MFVKISKDEEIEWTKCYGGTEFPQCRFCALADIYPVSIGSIKNHLYHRFGLNIRFGNPKK